MFNNYLFQSVLSRLGIISKVAIPDKRKETPSIIEEEEEDEPILKDVPSVVKVKPRILPPNAKQANKTLLLKAVADAQRSIAQTPKVGSTKVRKLVTKKRFQTFKFDFWVGSFMFEY